MSIVHDAWKKTLAFINQTFRTGSRQMSAGNGQADLWGARFVFPQAGVFPTQRHYRVRTFGSERCAKKRVLVFVGFAKSDSW